MKTLSIPFFALSIAICTISCKDEVKKAADCTQASEDLADADKAFAATPSKENCLAVNNAVNAYRTACEKLPDGHDTLNCDLYKIYEELNK